MPLSNEKTGKQKGINWNRKTTTGPLFIPSCFVHQFEMLYFDNRWGKTQMCLVQKIQILKIISTKQS